MLPQRGPGPGPEPSRFSLAPRRAAPRGAWARPAAFNFVSLRFFFLSLFNVNFQSPALQARREQQPRVDPLRTRGEPPVSAYTATGRGTERGEEKE